MLEADAQEIARWRALAESNARLVDAVNQRREREQRLAQQVAVPVPMTDIEVLRAARTVQSVFEHVPHRDVIEFVRAIEAHHGIGAKP
jgi:threonine synthase